MAEPGYIKLHRRLLDSWLMQAPDSVFKVALYVLLRARWQADAKQVPVGAGDTVAVARGQLLVRTGTLADELGFTDRTIRNALRYLEERSVLTSERVGNRGLLLTVCNWEIYQVSEASHATNVSGPASVPVSGPLSGPLSGLDQFVLVSPKKGRREEPDTRETDGQKTVKAGKRATPRSSRKSCTPEWAAAFDTFWSAWPKREAKARARSAWAKHDPKGSEPVADRVSRIIAQARAKAEAYQRDIASRPNPPANVWAYFPLPATWLNGSEFDAEDGTPQADLYRESPARRHVITDEDRKRYADEERARAKAIRDKRRRAQSDARNAEMHCTRKQTEGREYSAQALTEIKSRIKGGGNA